MNNLKEFFRFVFLGSKRKNNFPVTKSPCILYGLNAMQDCLHFETSYHNNMGFIACDLLLCPYYSLHTKSLKQIDAIKKHESKKVCKGPKHKNLTIEKIRTDAINSDILKKINAMLTIQIRRNKALYFQEGFDLIGEITCVYFASLKKFGFNTIGVYEFSLIMTDIQERIVALNRLYGTSQIKTFEYEKDENGNFVLDKNDKRIKRPILSVLNLSELKKHMHNKITSFGTLEIDVSHILEMFEQEND